MDVYERAFRIFGSCLGIIKKQEPPLANKTSDVIKIGLFTAVSLVVANMVGTGVFTSLGFQVGLLPSVFTLVMLWVVGGIIALCGALSYGELGAALPRSGGEYHLLSNIYNHVIGYMSGWISATLGFAAPTALAAIALGKYTQAVFPGISGTHLAASVVILISLIHASSIRTGSRFQDISTVVKVMLIMFFVAAAFVAGNHQDINSLPSFSDLQLMTSSGFAVSLIYVSYAYTGWNAAIYIVGEIKQPSRNLPKSLFMGSLIVLTLYVLLNYVFLYTVPMSDLDGKVEVGFLSATVIFGEVGGKMMSLIIATLLISTVSAMVFVGPRISMTMGEDMPLFQWLGKKSGRNIPVNAIIFQMMITLVFIYTSSFEQVLIYASFMLTLFTTLTVLGVIVLRFKAPGLDRPYRTWGYPITPLIYVVLNVWIMVYVFIDKTQESLIGIGIALVGLILYALNSLYKKRAIAKAK